MGMLPIQCGDGHNTAHCRCEGNNTAEYFKQVFVDCSGKIGWAFQQPKMAIP